ncbi:hypothetical protein D9M70_23010 [compost metagenome]
MLAGVCFKSGRGCPFRKLEGRTTAFQLAPAERCEGFASAFPTCLRLRWNHSRSHHRNAFELRVGCAIPRGDRHAFQQGVQCPSECIDVSVCLDVAVVDSPR